MMSEGKTTGASAASSTAREIRGQGRQRYKMGQTILCPPLGRFSLLAHYTRQMPLRMFAIQAQLASFSTTHLARPLSGQEK